MSLYNIYKLRFVTPLHLSKGKMNTYESSDTILHSDTLKSAIYVAARQVCSEGWADTFMQDIRISSAFPFDNQGCYLPVPLSYNPSISAEHRKEYKNIKYLTIKQFEEIAKGGETELLKNNKAMQPKIWEEDVTQRVKINHDADSEPYYLERAHPT